MLLLLAIRTKDFLLHIMRQEQNTLGIVAYQEDW